MNYLKYLWIGIFAVWTSVGSAQTFDAGLILGVNASQVNGDQLAGYNKLGITGGITGGARLSDDIRLGLDILYSERGSRAELIPDNSLPPVYIRINYFELPLYIEYKDWLFAQKRGDEPYHKMRFRGGLSYARLMSSDIEGIPIAQSTEEEFLSAFNENDLSFILGMEFMFNRNWGVGARFTRSIIPLFNNDKHENINNDSLIGYFFTFRFTYHL